MNEIIACYFLIISLVSASVTVADKSFAIKGRRRIPEKHLFIIAFLGGSFSMYCTMHAVRHKTKHKRFMIGLPMIMILQVVLALALVSIYSGVIG